MLKRNLSLACVLALLGVSQTFAGQPIERFRGADHLAFSQGSAEPRYGNLDGNVRITMQVFLLGQQVFDNPSSSPETRFEKNTGSLDFTLRLSDFDPNLPPDTVTLVGTDLGNDLLQHSINSLLPGPYSIAGTFNGVTVDLTLRNVRVTGTLQSQGSNAVTLPQINPVLGEYVDVQFDDPTGASNTIVAVPGQVSGWVGSPIFTVQSLRVDVTGIQQAVQVPAKIVSPSSFLINLGRLDAGNNESLAGFDTNALRVCKFVVPNNQVAPITVEVNGQLSSAPLFLSLLSSSRMTTAGVFQQTIELFDFSTNSYGTGDSRTDAVTTAYSDRTLHATGAVSRYLGQGSTVKARYRIRQTGPASNPAWCSEHDFLGWIVTP